jgi:hypothetical protein
MAKWFELDDDEERAVAAFMTRVAGLSGNPVLRDPMQLWWKGQLVRRWEAERRVQQPLDLMERIEILAGVVAAGGLIVWAVPNVFRLLAEPLRQLLG